MWSNLFATADHRELLAMTLLVVAPQWQVWSNLFATIWQFATADLRELLALTLLFRYLVASQRKQQLATPVLCQPHQEMCFRNRHKGNEEENSGE